MNNKTKNEEFIMKPTVDYCFKELMAVEKVRKGFVAAVLKISPEEIRSIELKETILRKHTEEEKIGILDVYVELNNQTQIDMEMQILYFQYWKERTIYYVSRMYADTIQEGMDYDALKKCVQISILDFILFPDNDEFYSCYQLREQETGELYSDLLEFHVLELPKLANTTHPEDAILRWAKFFHGKTREEMEEMAVKDEYIYEAFQMLDRMSMDEEKRREYDAREKAIRDHNSLVKQYRTMGLEQGRAEGKEKEKSAISKLISKLIEDNRIDLVQEMAKDEQLMDQLLMAYDLYE